MAALSLVDASRGRQGMRVAGIWLCVAGIVVPLASFSLPFLLIETPDAARDPEGYSAAMDTADRIAGTGFLGGVVLAIVGIFLLLGHRRRLARRDAMIRAHGMQAVATTTRIRDTGVTVGESPRVEFHLRIDVPGRPSYTVTKRHVVPRLEVGRHGVGTRYPCSVLPDDPDAVVVDFDRPDAVDAVDAEGPGDRIP